MGGGEGGRVFECRSGVMGGGGWSVGVGHVCFFYCLGRGMAGGGKGCEAVERGVGAGGADAPWRGGWVGGFLIRWVVVWIADGEGGVAVGGWRRGEARVEIGRLVMGGKLRVGGVQATGDRCGKAGDGCGGKRGGGSNGGADDSDLTHGGAMATGGAMQFSCVAVVAR